MSLGFDLAPEPDRGGLGDDVGLDMDSCSQSSASNMLPLAKLVPNAVTLVALCFALSSVNVALAGNFRTAVLMIVVAALLDVMDGRFARMLNAQSKMGGNLDSLCDLVNFGFCPAFLVYLWSMNSIPFLGWGAVMVSTMCAALRLAKFNVLSEEMGNSVEMQSFFRGVPTPAAGGLIMMPMIMSFAGFGPELAPETMCFIVFIAGFLMVSNIPTISTKSMKIRRNLVVPLLFVFGLCAILLIMTKWIALMLSGFIYMALIPVSSFSYYRLKKSRTLEVSGSEGSSVNGDGSLG